MPVPEPREGEEQNDFISRCISQLSNEDPDTPAQQIQAICFSKWREMLGIENLHPDFMRILKLFVARYGEDGGLLKFETFLKANRLNPSLAYLPNVQFREDFQWVAPLIQKYREDKDAKYYLIRCLTANVSLNNNDYSDFEKMRQAAPTLSYRPVNIDHFHEDQFSGLGSPGGWMQYPRTRMDFTMADDLSVEGTMRVDNADRLLQMMLEHDPSIPEEEWIVHPSIEGRPTAGGTSPRDGYHFTSIALLRKGRQLPGDPLTEIYPLMLHEALSEAIRETFVDRMEQEGDKEMSVKEYTDPPPSQQPEVPIQCNQCGWTINRPSIEKEEITCPSCNTKGQFTLKPVEESDPTDNFTNNEAMLEAFLTALEAIPEDERAGFEHIEGETFPQGKISADEARVILEALNKATLTEDLKKRVEALMELFKPPHGGTALSGDPQAISPAAGGTAAPLEKPKIPTVGDVTGAQIGIEEAAKLREEIANLTSKVNELTKERDAALDNITDITETNINLKEENVGLRRNDGETIALRTQLEDAHGKIAKEKTKVATQKGQIKKFKETIRLREKTIEDGENSVEKLEEQLGAVKVELDKVRRDLNEESEKRATAEQKARNADVDRSRMQLENADLREEAAKHTRELSDIAQKRSEDARRLQSLEEQLASEKKDKAKLEEMVRQLNDDVKLARRRVKRLDKELKDAGIVEIDKEGNILL